MENETPEKPSKSVQCPRGGACRLGRVPATSHASEQQAVTEIMSASGINDMCFCLLHYQYFLDYTLSSSATMIDRWLMQ